MMRKNSVLLIPLILGLLTSCGENSTEPSSPEVSPSVLSMSFTGDSIDVMNSIMLSQPEINSGENCLDENSSKGFCEVTANWTICDDASFSNYTLYRSLSSDIESEPSSATVLGVFDDPNANTYIDSSVTWATSYFYALKTTDTNENSVWSNEVQIQTPGSITPSMLDTTNVSYSFVDLVWTQCTDNDFFSYSLFRSFEPNIQDDTSYSDRILYSNTVNDTSYTDSEISSNSTYFYALMTTSTKGVAVWSNELEVAIPANLDIPDSVTTSVSVGDRPYGVCCLPSGDYVYVANLYDDTITVIRTSDNTVVATIPIGNMPYEICSLPSGEYLYVSMYGENTVKVIRSSNNQVVDTIDVGDVPAGITSLPSGEFVYVTNMSDASVSVIRTSDNTVVATVSVGFNPYGVCSIASGEYVYVTNSQDDNVMVIRTSDNTITSTISVGTWPYRICSVPSGEYVYVVNNYDSSVSVIRTSDNSVISTIDVGQTPQTVCSLPSGDYVYVTNYNGNTISIISTATYEIVGTVQAVSEPFAICSHPMGDKLYATGLYDNCVYVIE